jgi:hypothetical protein
MTLSRQLESTVGTNQLFKHLCQIDAFMYVLLKTLNAKRANYEPKLESPKATGQTNLPVHVVDCSA